MWFVLSGDSRHKNDLKTLNLDKTASCLLMENSVVSKNSWITSFKSLVGTKNWKNNLQFMYTNIL